jgi:hypothetical protein
MECKKEKRENEIGFDYVMQYIFCYSDYYKYRLLVIKCLTLF